MARTSLSLPIPNVPERHDVTGRYVLYAVLALNTVFALALARARSATGVTDLHADAATAVLPVVIALAGIARIQPWRPDRRRDVMWIAPFLMAAGALSFGIGQGAWTWAERAAGGMSVPLAAATPGYVIARLLLLAGVLLLPGRLPTRASRPRVLVEGLLALTAVTTFSWYFIIGPVVLHGDNTPFAAAIGTSYPLSELLLVICLVIVSVRSGGSAARRTASLLLSAMACLILADSIYDYQLLHDLPIDDALLDPLRSLGWSIIALGAFRVGSWEQQEDTGPVTEPARLREMWRTGVTYLLVPAVMLLAAYAWKAGEQPGLDQGVYVGLLVLIVLIVLHQFVVIAENIEMNQHLDVGRQARAAQQALRESEHRFRRLIQDMPVGVLLVGPSGHVLVTNRAVREMLGLREDAVAGDPYFAAVSSPVKADYTAPEQRAVSRALRTGEAVRNVIIQLQDAGHGLRSILMDAIPQLSEDGTVEQVICTFADVTQRWAAEEALRASEARFRTIFEYAPIGFEIVDMDGKFVQTNRALQEMLGYSARQMRGMHWSALTHPEDVGMEESLDERLDRGEIDRYQLENRHIRRDGSVVWTRQTVSGVRNNRGQTEFAIGMVEDISERKRAQEALAHQALHDALTDLPNRTLLQDRVQQAIHVAQREGTPFALLVLDLDRFKELNDSFGHLYGDLLLQHLGNRLVQVLREADTVARLGGDEFAVLLAGADRYGAEQTSQKILQAVRSPFMLEDNRFDVDTSIGIALYPEHGHDAHSLLRQADVAMYVAKRAKSGYALYSADDDENTPSRLLLLSELREAIEGDQLTLYFQPKLNVRTGRVESVEALVRWQHPVRGLMVPDEFIPLAEHTGLIKQLDMRVLSLALAQCRVWHAQGLPLRVGINLSARHLQDAELVHAISALLQEHETDPRHLEVEVTESVVMSDPLCALSVLSSLHDMGVRICIDDFGTGYSSLSYLQRLPADEIKIDKSFVLNLATDTDSSFIARAVIDLGHNLRLQVVAEGVDNQASLDLLARMGCDLIQGYFLSPPLPADALIARLRELSRGARRLPPRDERSA